jgi:N-acetylglucosamine-6-sulfatase
MRGAPVIAELRELPRAMTPRRRGDIVSASPEVPMTPIARSLPLVAVLLALGGPQPAANEPLPPASVQPLPRVAGAPARNIVFILTDDHRYDAMSFMGHPIVQTPNLDRIARRGVHLRNAFVTTSLCSPSRATILTGLYAHQHKVVDNNTPVPAGTVFFPQYLQRAGYQTALVGKWHMGADDGGPQPGFDHWVSFAGQGSYLPSKAGLNVNGTPVPQKGYITDELTEYAIEWLQGRDRSRPFFLHLAHKGVHNDYVPAARSADFLPAERHRGRFEGATFTPPKSQHHPPELEARRPRWVRDQRNSWHGVDFPYHSTLDVGHFFKRYAETLLAVDDSVGRVLDYLAKENLLDSTLVIYMGDNGFAFGEHGLIDKRTAYEASMRVPMVMQCPELFSGGGTVDAVVANLDVAPTILSAAGLQPPAHMVGGSMVPLARGEQVPWRTELLYEYYWERNYPQTPTVFALRTDRYKFIRYHGLWDIDELFDLQADPLEMHNLAYTPEHAARARQLSDRLFAVLGETNGLAIPLYPDRGAVTGLRDSEQAAPFPPVFVTAPGGGGQ